MYYSLSVSCFKFSCGYTHTHSHKHTLSRRTRPGIYVHYLVPGSKAETCGNIKPGDRILEANGVDLRDATVDEAAAFMMVSREIYTIYKNSSDFFQPGDSNPT